MSERSNSDDHQPISAATADALFAHLADAPGLVLAVSGGPDSMALMWLAARWRKALAKGPKLTAVTVDHGLRPAAAREARAVKQTAKRLDLPHRTLRWHGDKPDTGVSEAARAERYRLLTRAAKAVGASHIVTAHTRDDQAETLLMRLLRGSGVAGLAAMAGLSERDGMVLARPLLTVSKAQLIATVQAAGLGFVEDPTNRDPAYTRPRLRALMPALVAEGGDSRNLARLAARIARANAAIEVMTDGAARYLALASGAEPKLPVKDQDAASSGQTFDARAFAVLPDEIRLRLLMRAINRYGSEGPAELGKTEVLLAALDRTLAQASGAGAEKDAGAAWQGRLEGRFRQTLAGALVSLVRGQIRVARAPARRGR